MSTRRIRSLQDVVDWGLCVGCGACYYACETGGVSLANIEAVGIRPQFNGTGCASCTQCLSVCPGYRVEGAAVADSGAPRAPETALVGPLIEVWEGHATDPEIRHAASSGGALTALALYCLEKEDMAFVLHSGMDPGTPWLNRTVQSRTRAELLACTGSRYAPASPCDGLGLIEESDRPCVFIGKPCDATGVALGRRDRPRLDARLGLVLTFFCAGTPSTQGTKDLLRSLGVEAGEVSDLRYRGRGWPGSFTAVVDEGRQSKSATYDESWGFVQKYRPFRCHLCPDGTGQVADISCGDAWHRYANNGDAGRSLVLVRTRRGQELLRRAREAGYLELAPSGPDEVVAAQVNLLSKRQQLLGRLVAMRMLRVPAPRFKGFSLCSAWGQLPLAQKAKSVLGTARRIVRRGLYHRGSWRQEGGRP